MKSILALLSMLTIVTSSSGQPFFEWSTGSEYASMAFLYLAPHPAGVVAGAESSPLNYLEGKPAYLNSDGRQSIISGYSLNHSSYRVLFFDSAGIILWSQQFDADFAILEGMAVNSYGEIILLVEVADRDEDETGNPVGYMPDLTDEMPHPAGYSLVFLSADGQLKKVVPVPKLNAGEIEVTSFEFHSNGTLLLAGEGQPGKPALNLEQEVLAGGGDFVMMLDTTGIPQWVDVVSYRSNSCCSRLSKHVSMSVAPDGTIYFGGAYQNGGIFSNGWQTLVPKKYDEKYDGYEAYVVSYTPDGKINWIKTYQEQSMLLSLQATNEGIFAAHQTRGGTAFGLQADTSSVQRAGVAFLNTKGKVKWNRMIPFFTTEDMMVSEEGEIIMIQTGRYMEQWGKGTIGGSEIPDRTDVVLTSVDKKGKVKLVKTGRLSITARNEPVLITRDSKGNSYLAAQLFCGLKLELALIDKSLPRVECYGGVAVLGKIKF